MDKTYTRARAAEEMLSKCGTAAKMLKMQQIKHAHDLFFFLLLLFAPSLVLKWISPNVCVFTFACVAVIDAFLNLKNHFSLCFCFHSCFSMLFVFFACMCCST